MNVGTILQSKSCSDLPNPSLCSCLNSTIYTDSILYNSSSICSIDQNHIPLGNLNALLGFIQLGLFFIYKKVFKFISRQLNNIDNARYYNQQLELLC